MGILTLTEMIDEVQVGLGGRRDDDQVVTSTVTGRIPRWINAAYRYVSQPNIARHPELLTPLTVGLLVTDTETYTIPVTPQTTADYFAIHDARVVETPADPTTRIQTLQRITMREFRQMRPDYAQGGLPEFYSENGSTAGARQLVLLPRPSAQYAGWTAEIDVWRVPDALTAGGQVTELRADWDWVVIQGAIWWGHRSLGNQPAAELAKTDFDALINNQVEANRVGMEDRVEQLINLDLQDYEDGITNAG